MQTNFTAEQLTDPLVIEANEIFRKCVHCGFCTATCPTFVILGDEVDSPRGRIYLIKNMLESGKPATATVAKHLDRCLTCLSCMTTCPSGVHYMHLMDQARVRVEQTYTRPLPERLLRWMLGLVIPNPGIFRLALMGAWLARPFKGLMPGRLKGMVGMAPKSIPSPSPVDSPQVFPAQGERRKRVVLMTGCAQKVLRPEINEATVRLLTRHGCEVVIPKGAGCCGALVHHMGEEEKARTLAKANITAWTRELENGGLDAVVINASGCGTTVKDYGFLFKDDSVWGEKAARIGALAKDVTEVMTDLELAAPVIDSLPVVAYHSACSMQHGQKILDEPKKLLSDAGFQVRQVAKEGHICCGSAGTYNLLQPELSGQLRERKVANLEATGADLIAAGNIGCMVHIAEGTKVPVVHTVELLDWATGGPKPRRMDAT
jgi:glycolate oxidase iron-sulfur subunit